MISNISNNQASNEDLFDDEMAEECPSINKLSKGCVHKNPLWDNHKLNTYFIRKILIKMKIIIDDDSKIMNTS